MNRIKSSAIIATLIASAACSDSKQDQDANLAMQPATMPAPEVTAPAMPGVEMGATTPAQPMAEPATPPAPPAGGGLAVDPATEIPVVEPPATPPEPENPAAVPAAPPGSPAEMPDAPAEMPDAPAEMPDAPAEMPDAPAEMPEVPVEMPDAPVAENPPAAPPGSVTGDAAKLLSPTIKITDPVPGFASQGGGTTGGGTDLSKAVTVSSMGELENAISGSDPKIVLVEPGTYKGKIRPDSNTTIIGTAPGVLLGGIRISSKENIIVRNLAVQDEKCSSYDDCKGGADAVLVQKSTHVWVDHVDIADGKDGNFDMTSDSNYLTCSWCSFRYTYDKEHRFSNLIHYADRGNLKVTLMYSWWGERVEQRQPRCHYGDIHLFNNLHTSQDADYGVGPGTDVAVIAENIVFNMPGVTAIRRSSALRGMLAHGNIGSSKDMNWEEGEVFDIPYQYTLVDAKDVEAMLTADKGGAGNTVTFER